ncbi:hypothetical protein ACSI5G_003212 [Vibrio vulnificus]
MYRRIRYSSGDYYLNYLNVSAHYIRNGICSGKFNNYIKETFGIKKLPYNIELIDLIKGDDSRYELFVDLPEEYFNEWVNYPYFGGFENSEATKSTGAIYHDILIVGRNDNELSDFLHPYDSYLRVNFLNRLKSNPVDELVIKEHKNGRKYRPYEFYLAHWRAYIIFEVVNNCMFIEKYLNEERGRLYFTSEYQRVNDYWVTNYASTFKRVSTYRSFVARFINSRINYRYNGEEVSTFLLGHLQSTKEDLLSDMTGLLTIHKYWENLAKSSGLLSYEVGLKELKKDIYFIFEWLCHSGFSESELLRKWSSNNCKKENYSFLEDVLDFEEFKFRDSFTRYVPVYASSEIEDWMNKDVNLIGLYSELENLNSFYPWIRSFYDLHKSINNKDSIHLVQPRIIDFLIVFTIRTEVLIRDLIYTRFSYENYNLKDVFSYISNKIKDKFDRNTISSVSDKSNWDMTVLRNKPEDIFEKIHKCSVGKCWPKNRKYFFVQILKFVTSRNYFAHHSYKDDDLNFHANELSREVLTSCLFSVLYITSVSNLEDV